MTNKELDKTIIQYSQTYEIPVEKIKAIISVNTNWNQKFFKKACLKDFFVGITGISFTIAQGLGFYEGPRALLKPIDNIDYCCKHLKSLIEKYKGFMQLWDYVYSGFNFEVAFRETNGTFLNQNTVDKYKKAELKYIRKDPFLNYKNV